MRFIMVYLVLVSFSFLSLTPAGISLAELRADDGLELDELDLGLEEEEEEEEESTSKKSRKSEDEDLDEEDESGEEESSENSEESDESAASEDEEESPASKRSSETEDSESYSSNGKKIMAFYMFEDSHTVKSAAHVAAETALHLADSQDYDYVGFEAAFTAGSSSWMKNAKKDFEEGKQLYADLGVEEAIDKFKSALKTLENNIDKISDMSFISEVVFYLGASYKLLDEDEQAESYFTSYISMNPDSTPDNPAFSDEVMSAFKDAKGSRKGSGKGSVKVQSSVEGAIVFIDGKVVGMTPATLRGVKAGKHYYRIHKNGFRDVGGSISVREGKTASLNETLTKNSSASDVKELESAMKSDFGSVTMVRKATDLAQDAGADNVFLVKASLGSDERLKYQGYMIDCNKKEFKKSEAVFDLPERGNAGSSAALQQFNKALVDDPYEYKAISDLLMEEVDLLGLSDKPADDQQNKEKKPVYKEWWLWTVVGVVVLAGAGVGTYFAITSSKSGSSGATLDVNFQ